jgi:hypothetical protein
MGENSSNPVTLAAIAKEASVTLETYTIFELIAAATRREQGCQIFIDTIYQNEGKYTKIQQHCQRAIKYSK